jgi:hypothetical protein
MRRLSRLAVFGLVTAAAFVATQIPGRAEASVGATLTGKWTITITTDQGEFDTNWDLQQHEDGTLTGDIEGRQGSSPAESGWVKGDSFAFSVTRDFQGQSFEIDYAGTFTAVALEGTLTAGDGQFEANFTGVRAEADGDKR